MKKSVAIIGKGPSVLKSTKEFVDTFDEVAICNFPPMEGYEKYIGNRATYHFLNIHPEPHDGFAECFPDNSLSYVHDYGQATIPTFKSQYGFDPSCGIIAFEYFVTKEEFDTICLIGFDFFKVGERGYFFPVEETQQSHRYLYRNDGSQPFNTQGVRIKSSGHDSDKSEKFVHDMVKKYDKELIIR